MQFPLVCKGLHTLMHMHMHSYTYTHRCKCIQRNQGPYLLKYLQAGDVTLLCKTLSLATQLPLYKECTVCYKSMVTYGAYHLGVHLKH